MNKYVAIGLIVGLLAAFGGTYYAGHSAGVAEESARTMKAVTDSVSAMQQAMAKQRTESRAIIAGKDKELDAARKAANKQRNDMVANNEELRKCFGVVVPDDVVSTIWLQ